VSAALPIEREAEKKTFHEWRAKKRPAEAGRSQTFVAETGRINAAQWLCVLPGAIRKAD
tara:strand:+ start:1039 stop:1215 length:177 start_codon:yes stop_codon:yes gene_type:complete